MEINTKPPPLYAGVGLVGIHVLVWVKYALRWVKWVEHVLVWVRWFEHVLGWVK